MRAAMAERATRWLRCGASVGTCRPSDRALLRGLRRGLVCSGAELLCVAWQLVVRADTTVEALCVDASGVPPELVVTTYGYSGRC